MAFFDGTDAFFDSRDVIERIAELESDLEGLDSDNDYDEIIELRGELTPLIALQEEAEGYIPDWQYGETFISEDYFEEYAKELAYDTGAIDREASWPLNRIDWEAAAADLMVDYTEFEFRGTTYYAR